MKGAILLAMVLLIMPIASAVQITSVSVDSPNGLAGFYNDTFTINATTNVGPLDLTYEVGTDPPAAMQQVPGDNTKYYAIVDVLKEGNYNITITATSQTNSSDQATDNTINLNIDTLPPEIEYGAGKTRVNVTQAVHTQGITVYVEITDAYPDSAKISVGTNPPIDVTLSGGIGNVQTTPSQLGCAVSGTCAITVLGQDQAGNIVIESSLSVDVIASAPNNTLHLMIVNPEDSGVERDSILVISLDITADGVSVPSSSTRFCNYQVLNEDTGGSLVNAGTFFKNDFIVNVDNYDLGATGGTLADGDYSFELTCYDSQDNPYTAQSSFVVLDVTAPDVEVKLIGISPTSANISVNSSEEYMIKSLEYKVIGNDNATKIDTQDVFNKYYEFTLPNLQIGKEYVVQVKGIDRAGEEFGRDENEFVATETFKAAGNSLDDAKNKEKTVEDITVKGRVKEGSTSGLKGLEYSHGIDWLREDAERTITVTNFEMNIREIIVASREDIRNIKIDIVTSEDPPEDFDVPLPENTSVFQYMSIDAINAPSDKLKFAKIRFEVNEIWLRDHELSVKDVALFRLVDGEWDQLPTTLTKEGALLHSYEALSPGFSMFFIGGKKGVQTSLKEEEKDTGSEIARKYAEDDTPEPREGLGDLLHLAQKQWYFWAIGGLVLLVILIFAYYGVVASRQGSSKKPKVEMIDHKKVKKHMKRLESFVDDALEKGYSKDKLKDNLVDSGWDSKLVDFVLRRK